MSNKERIGVFGGAFDPIHFGHLSLAETCRHYLQLDQVIFIPTSDHPFKHQLTPSIHRLEMVKLAIEGNDQFHLSDMEISRKGVSYTVDTIKELASELGEEHDYFFLMGSDNLIHFPSWKSPREILQFCKLAVLSRPEYQLPTLPDFMQNGIVQVPTILVNLSSTDIRDGLGRGESLRYLLPDNVLSYILSEQLYLGNGRG